jgi:hypothetical protein
MNNMLTNTNNDESPKSATCQTNPRLVGRLGSLRERGTESCFNSSYVNGGHIPAEDYEQWVKATPRLQNDNPAKLTFKDSTSENESDESDSQESETAF